MKIYQSPITGGEQRQAELSERVGSVMAGLNWTGMKAISGESLSLDTGKMLGDIQSTLTVIYSTIPEQLPRGPNGKRDHFIEAGAARLTPWQ